MKNTAILLGLTIILFFSACKDKSSAQEIKVLTPQEFRDATANKNVQLLDVRTPEEFAEGHLEAAKNINVLDSTFASKAERLNVNEPIYIYCRSGHRSAKAALILKNLGFKEIKDMQGGYLNWESADIEDED